jgi:hypothetical protein
VPFEDLFKLRALFETDEGRRVFCFILFQTIRQTKKDAKVCTCLRGGGGGATSTLRCFLLAVRLTICARAVCGGGGVFITKTPS